MEKKVKKKVGGFSILLKDLRALQAQEIYPKLVNKLQIDLAEEGEKTLRSLIAEAGEDRRQAGMLYTQAKGHRERLKRRWETSMGEWMVMGRKAIAELKKAKQWDGSVYGGDVERWVLANIEDSRKLSKKVEEAQEIYGTAKSLYEAYEYRLSALQTFAKLTERKFDSSLEELGKLQNERLKAKAAEEIGKNG